MAEPNVKYCPKCQAKMIEGPLHALAELLDSEVTDQTEAFSLHRVFKVTPYRCDRCNYVELYFRGTAED
jgi:predicted Zn-ribbon and HTH transcriptional regulator